MFNSNDTSQKNRFNQTDIGHYRYGRNLLSISSISLMGKKEYLSVKNISWEKDLHANIQVPKRPLLRSYARFLSSPFSRWRHPHPTLSPTAWREPAGESSLRSSPILSRQWARQLDPVHLLYCSSIILLIAISRHR